jgi:GNAT superfamily N-acetyltransferase
MRIRPVTAADTPAVAALSGELGYATGVGDMSARLAAVLAAPGHAVFAAEGADGAVLGWVHVCARLLLIDPLSAFVEGLVVAPGKRRRGVGRALMAAAEDWARDQGALVIRLRSAATREDAHAFYRVLGYHQGKTALGFEKQLPPYD